MRFPSLKCRLAVFTPVLAAALAVAATASAGAEGFYVIEKPGISCRSVSPNASPWGGELTNDDSRTQYFWCPLDQTALATSAWVNLSPGWANPQSCTLSVVTTANNAGWFLSGSGVNHNAQTNTDGVGFNQSLPYVVPAIGSAVTCVMPPGATLYDYDERVQVYFDYFESW